MYTNIPPSNNHNPAATAYSNAYDKPMPLETNTYNLMKGFFEAKGFDKLASDALATTFIRQAATDGYNALDVLSTLKNMDSFKLTGVINEILNYNRYKTSYLGTTSGTTAFQPISRNVVA
jgi:hypothetical protein